MTFLSGIIDKDSSKKKKHEKVTLANGAKITNTDSNTLKILEKDVCISENLTVNGSISADLEVTIDSNLCTKDNVYVTNNLIVNNSIEIKKDILVNNNAYIVDNLSVPNIYFSNNVKILSSTEDNDLDIFSESTNFSNNVFIQGKLKVNTALCFSDGSNITLQNNKLMINSQSVEIPNLVIQGNLNLGSDENLKKNIKNLNNSLEKISSLRGVSYNRNDLDDDKKIHIGFIAQEIEKVYPELVDSNLKDGFKSVSYINLIPALVESIKTLNKKNEYLEEKINKMQK